MRLQCLCVFCGCRAAPGRDGPPARPPSSCSSSGHRALGAIGTSPNPAAHIDARKRRALPPAPTCVASRIDGPHAATGCGLCQRSAPTGGAAYGTPSNAMPSGSTSPRTGPSDVVTRPSSPAAVATAAAKTKTPRRAAAGNSRGAAARSAVAREPTMLGTTTRALQIRRRANLSAEPRLRLRLQVGTSARDSTSSREAQLAAHAQQAALGDPITSADTPPPQHGVDLDAERGGAPNRYLQHDGHSREGPSDAGKKEVAQQRPPAPHFRAPTNCRRRCSRSASRRASAFTLAFLSCAQLLRAAERRARTTSTPCP